MKSSRDKWKKKCRTVSKQARYDRREKLRIKHKRNRLRCELQQIKLENSKLKKRLEERERALVIDHKVDLIFLALQLFLVARISFRAVSRVLSVMAPWLGLDKAPCPQTVINWVTRLSISRMKYETDPSVAHQCNGLFPNGFFVVLDASIGLGSGKIMAVLLLDANHYLNHPGQAPSLQDVYCTAVSVADTWTGDSVSVLLDKVNKQLGKPLGYVKDGGADLQKAVRLLSEEGGSNHSIDDVSHVIANLLKHKYEHDPGFALFISSCGKVSTRLKQTILASLAPPKVSRKARFMNLHRLVAWASSLLALSPRGRAANGSMLQKLRDSFDQLPECKRFIRDFLGDAEPLLEVQKILKKNGLSVATLEQCLPIIKTIPSASVRNGFNQWNDKHIEIARELGLEQCGLPITSDCVESLFGVAKRHGTGEIKDANRIALRIPALCGSVSRQDAINVMAVSVQEQQRIEGSIPSLISQRREVFKHGDPERISVNDTRGNVELIAGPKSEQKTPVNDSETVTYVNNNGPGSPACAIPNMC